MFRKGFIFIYFDSLPGIKTTILEFLKGQTNLKLAITVHLTPVSFLRALKSHQGNIFVIKERKYSSTKKTPHHVIACKNQAIAREITKRAISHYSIKICRISELTS